MNDIVVQKTDRPELAAGTVDWRAFDYVYQQLLWSCHELGLVALFDGNADRALTFEQLVEGTGLPPHSLRLLLLSGCAFGLLRKHAPDARYSLAGELATSGHALPDDFGWIRRVYLPSWAHLSESLRNGVNAGLNVLPGSGGTLYERLPNYPELEQVFSRARGQTVVHRRLPLLLGALGTIPTFNHVLDVGGGDGTTARAIAAAYDHVRVTVLDLPSVAALGRNDAASLTQNRVEFVGGDAFAGEWPSGVDVVVFSAFLEIFSAERIQAALRQAYASLPVGGCLLINQTFCNDDETGPLWPAVLSLYFLNLASGEGMCYPASDFERWCLDAGFASVRQFAIHPSDDARVLIAHKGG
jgi:ubiquinone/menaquinone biosynthesis C-methylase UbiE